MGADIHGFVEVKQEGKWTCFEEAIFRDGFSDSRFPFDWRSYSMFSF